MDNLSGHWLKRARKCAGLTQERAAEKIGYSVDAVQRWEDGTRRPSVEALEDMAEAYGTAWLPAAYLRELTRGHLAQTLPAFEPERPMAQAVLKLLGAVMDFSERTGQLISMAADGRIDAQEESCYREIMQCAAKIGQATLELKFSEMGVEL